jgi:hypothetical protein
MKTHDRAIGTPERRELARRALRKEFGPLSPVDYIPATQALIREGRICFAAPGKPVRNRQARELAAALRYHDLDTVDLLWFRVWKRLQEYGIDDAEDRRVRTDPERKGYDCSRRKPGAPP